MWGREYTDACSITLLGAFASNVVLGVWVGRMGIHVLATQKLKMKRHNLTWKIL